MRHKFPCAFHVHIAAIENMHVFFCSIHTHCPSLFSIDILFSLFCSRVLGVGQLIFNFSVKGLKIEAYYDFNSILLVAT